MDAEERAIDRTRHALIKIKRVYDLPPRRRLRFLGDRLRPRDVKKDVLHAENLSGKIFGTCVDTPVGCICTFGVSVFMEASMFTKTVPILNPNQTVMQVIQKYPETIPVWIRLKTNCFGCYLMRFCSLKYVSDVYDINLATLLEELEKAILV